MKTVLAFESDEHDYQKILRGLALLLDPDANLICFHKIEHGMLWVDFAEIIVIGTGFTDSPHVILDMLKGPRRKKPNAKYIIFATHKLNQAALGVQTIVRKPSLEALAKAINNELALLPAKGEGT